ncbi:MAG TPA: bifunctional DNA-formamidopyrimidine glycosylase/DNA-(apurinic or apyrimidinic site) lyase [Candidatus Acidoferrum sp.]|nr:bifunctional DNA-formamidopyrimidine glycosylase/DNA-(apurinic or apyrimidinic site) lyase [Candidatus Acidoferrum sp.]
MPELPEVETVARGLQSSIAGRRILSVTLRKTDFIDDPAAIERELPGRRIARVERFGKFMLVQLSRRAVDADEPNAAFMGPSPAIAQALLVHLGMTGHLAPHFAEQPLAKHTHVTFVLDDGRELRYTDARRFGRMAYLAGPALVAELERFGADPLHVSAPEFAQHIRASRSRIKALLLDQRVLRGVGNIYADESLWLAKIHPAKIGSKLKPDELERLRAGLRKILLKAIELRGSSISDFVDSGGIPGDYQQHHKVYGREGQKCFRCGAKIKRIIVAGRSSHFCPYCQPAPRGLRHFRKAAKRKERRQTSKK